MKKLISLSLVLMVVGLTANAQSYRTPVDQRGSAASADYAGYSSTRVAASGVAASQVICTGRCVLAGFIPSTGAAGSSMRFYDTSVAVLAGNMVDARLVLSTIYGTAETSVVLNRVPRPIRFNNGITLQLNSVAAGENVTVLYIDADPQ